MWGLDGQFILPETWAHSCRAMVNGIVFKPQLARQLQWLWPSAINCLEDKTAVILHLCHRHQRSCLELI